MQIYSVIGEGTRVTIVFPIVEEEKQQMKVLLIVDDEAYARQAVANTISWAEHGVEVHQVSSGKEALDLWKNVQ